MKAIYMEDEEVAIYSVNLQIPNVFRIVTVALAPEQFVASVRGKAPYDPDINNILLR